LSVATSHHIPECAPQLATTRFMSISGSENRTMFSRPAKQSPIRQLRDLASLCPRATRWEAQFLYRSLRQPILLNANLMRVKG